MRRRVDSLYLNAPAAATTATAKQLADAILSCCPFHHDQSTSKPATDRSIVRPNKLLIARTGDQSISYVETLLFLHSLVVVVVVPVVVVVFVVTSDSLFD